MKTIKGLRTFILTLVGILALVVGLKLLAQDRRHEAFFAFAGGVVGLVGAAAAKSVGTSAVNGEGFKQGVANLMGPTKPGEP